MARELLGEHPEKYLSKPGKHGFPVKHPDGKGLYLQVAAKDQGSWIVRFGEQWRSLGPFDIITPDEARARHLELYKRKLKGEDPIAIIDAEKQSKAITEAVAASTDPASETFGDLLTDYIAAQASVWKGTAEAVNWRSTFAKMPALLRLPVDQVTPKAQEIAAKVYDDNRPTQTRMRKRIRTLLKYSVTRETKGKRHKVKHLNSMPAKDIPQLMRELTALDSPDAKALMFTIHTAPRFGMTLTATWSEITTVDGQPVWAIPAGKMKMEEPFRIPLTPAAFDLLGKRGAHDELIFRSRIGKRGRLGHGAMMLLLKKLRPEVDADGRPLAMVHGMRSSLRDWVGDETSFARELGEIALAHELGDDTEQAYARGDQLAKRRPLMQAWSDFITAGWNAIKPPHWG
jgi:integrase